MKTNISKSKAVASSLFIISATAAILLFGRKSAPEATSATGFAPIASRPTAQVREVYGKIPLSFEANRGQADEAVNFRARGAGYTVALSPTEAVFVLARETDEPAPTMLRMNLIGANPGAAVEGQNELEGKVNYLIGNDPAQWRTNIPTFSRVRYTEVYAGIDVIYYGNQGQLEYDFVVAPGSDAGAIALEFAGAERLEVEAETGNLLLGIGEKTIRQHKPVVYQETSAGRRDVDGRYALLGGGRVGFQVGAYDPGATLIIDPVLVYSTYLGGNADSYPNGIAVDSSGNAYVVGGTFSTDFATVNAFQTTPKGGEEVFVTKLNAAGSAIVYSTYVGGSDGEFATGIAIDSAGNAYVVGNTSSNDFPTINAFQSTFGGGGAGFGDAFVFKLNPDGSALIYSTYLGGSDLDVGKDIAVDSAGNAYLTGYTVSTNFPTANAFQGTFGGPDSFGFGDAFVAKLNSAGSALVYSTYLGGNGDDSGRAIATDSGGNVYIIGGAGSSSFPTTVNAFQSTYGGGGDAFVTKLNAAGSALLYSTFLGGSGREGSQNDHLAIDSAGNAYVTGSTRSTNFPTANAFQSTLAGESDIFVAKLNATGSGLVYSTYLGGSKTDSGQGIAVDSAGNAYVTGDTSSADFPTANAFQNTFSGGFPVGDAFVTKFTATGALTYSSYLGGNEYDTGYGIAVDAAGDAYVTGITLSRCFPTTAGAFDTSSDNVFTGFITKISETAPAATLNACPSRLLNIATRMRVLTGDSALIGGFIITGSDPKPLIIRGIGPSLTGIQGVLANPTLELFDSNQVLLGSNDDWTTNRAEVEGTTIPPSNDLESAIVTTLAPGNYTAVLRGQNNGIGVGVVEVYDLNAAANSTLANISSRGFVDTGDNAMIGGFIVGGGSSETRVLIRGIGPSLASFFPNALENPTLELRNADGSLIRENDDWRDSQEAEIQGTTIPPSNNLESGIVASVGNGNYTAILRGKDNTTGVAVVEVYNLQ